MRYDILRVPLEKLQAERGSERSCVSIKCEIRTERSAWHFALLRDLSSQGFQLEWPASCGASSKVMIRIPGLEMLTAEVRWREGRFAGCEFAKLLSPYVLDHIIATGR